MKDKFELERLKKLKIEKLRQEIETKRKLPHLYSHRFYKWQREFFDSTSHMLFLNSANQVGKALCVDTPIPTPKGMVRMGDLKVGDQVINQYGKLVKIHAIPFEGVVESYRFTFDDGYSVIASKDHLWTCRRGDPQWKVLTTEEIISIGKYRPRTMIHNRFSVPLTEPTEVDSRSDIDRPYLYGRLSSYAESDEVIRESKLSDSCLTMSIDKRINLLRGIMDINGNPCVNGGALYYTYSEQFKNHLVSLVTGLGGKAIVDSVKDYWKIKIIIKINPFLAEKKAKFYFLPDNYTNERFIDKIDLVGDKKVKCITVDSEDGTFLCGYNHTVTHNSSIQIKKFIHWATEPSLWPKLWPTPPRLFWYLYPSLKVADAEYKKKWLPEFMPKEKGCPKYGYSSQHNSSGEIEAIHFNSGVSIYFKSYMTNTELLQTGSVWYLGFDEEMPVELWPELVSRVGAPNVQGYISGVFTPTLSQQFWFDVMEEQGTDKELLKEAHKIQVSLFDCTRYEDGTPSLWTEQAINRRINSLPSQEEIQRRIYGRFILNKSGRMFPSFSREKNYTQENEVPKDWVWFVGIDSGSGGEGAGHPAAITFVAVNPTFTRGRVVQVWKGTPDNVDGEDKSTTAGDILRKYIQLSKNKNIMRAVFDFADADLGIIAERNGIPLEKANKTRNGIDMMNTLFKNKILTVDVNRDFNNEELVGELINLKKQTRKTKAQDDGADSLRYAVNEIPWDLSVISEDMLVDNKKEKNNLSQTDQRRQSFDKPIRPNEKILSDMEDLNELYGD